MAMVTLIDRPGHKVEVRADVADQYEVCPHCNGNPYRWAHVGQSRLGGAWSGGWDIYETYVVCDCVSGIRRKPKAHVVETEGRG